MAGRKLPACWAESVVNAFDRARPRTPEPFSAIGSAAGGVALSAVQAARRQERLATFRRIRDQIHERVKVFFLERVAAAR